MQDVPSRPRLGRDFDRLWLGSTASALGDGMWLAALPLLAASLSRDPQVVSLLQFAAGLPWLLFGLYAGVLADRWDRRGLMWLSDLTRLGLAALLAVLVAVGAVTVPILLAVVFLLASVGTLFASAAPALLASVVSPADLHRANARLSVGVTSGRNVLGQSLGSVLFGAVPWLPFAVDALSFGVSARCVRGLPQTSGRPSSRRVSHEILEGLGWIWRVPAARGLAVGGCLLAFGTSAFLGIFVLYALEVLRLPAAAYGALISLYAAGSLLGGLVSPIAVRRLGLSRTTRLPAAVGALAFLAIGLTSTWQVAALALVVLGIATSVWNITSMTVRQIIAPQQLLGRISGVFTLLTVGSAPLGAPLGGALAKHYGLAAAIVFAAALSAVAALLIILGPAIDPSGVIT